MLTLMPTAEALTVDGGGVPPHLYPHGEETLLTITRAEGYDAGYDEGFNAQPPCPEPPAYSFLDGFAQGLGVGCTLMVLAMGLVFHFNKKKGE